MFVQEGVDFGHSQYSSITQAGDTQSGHSTLTVTGDSHRREKHAKAQETDTRWQASGSRAPGLAGMVFSIESFPGRSPLPGTFNRDCPD
jgi:hypothetical protein